jgi:hypothetical protein
VQTPLHAVSSRFTAGTIVPIGKEMNGPHGKLGAGIGTSAER